MKVISNIWMQYIFAFFPAILLCLMNFIVDGGAAGTAKFWSYTIIAFVVFSVWDLIKFIISKVKN